MSQCAGFVTIRADKTGVLGPAWAAFWAVKSREISAQGNNLLAHFRARDEDQDER